MRTVSVLLITLSEGDHEDRVGDTVFRLWAGMGMRCHFEKDWTGRGEIMVELGAA